MSWRVASSLRAASSVLGGVGMRVGGSGPVVARFGSEFFVDSEIDSLDFMVLPFPVTCGSRALVPDAEGGGTLCTGL